jgi:hypothetical protein
VPRWKKPSAFGRVPDLRQVGLEADEEIGHVNAGQTDKETADRVVADLEEHDHPEHRDEREGDRHANLSSGVGLPQPVPADGEPVHAVCSERERGHVQRRRRRERAEQGQPGEQVDAGEELQEAGHPDAPHAGREVHSLITLGVGEQFLRAVDHVAGAETKESQGQGRERGSGEAEDRLDRLH